MEAESIKTTALDRDLDKFLAPYKSDGTDLAYGHVLVKRMDKSRPRKADGPKGKEWAHPNYAVTTFIANQKYFAGVYTLIPKKNMFQPNWMAWLQAIKQPVTPDVDLGGFVSMMDGSESFGTQSRDIAMLVHGTTGLRADLGILQNPVASADSIYKVRSSIKDSQAPVVFVNTAGSPIEMQKTIGALTSVAYNHRGSAFNWVVVPPASKDALEAYLISLFGQEMGDATCTGFVKHLSLWITPARLQSWQITFYEVKQNAGQLLFFFPQTYYWGFSAGHGVIELKNHAGKDWTSDGWSFCSMTNSLCKKANGEQPGLFLGPLDGNKQQAGNEGDKLIDPTPRRTRKRKAVPHESVMEFDESLPGSEPTNPGAPGTVEQADVDDRYRVDSYAAGARFAVGYSHPPHPYAVVDEASVGHSRNIFDEAELAPGLGARHSPPSDAGDNYVDNRPEYAPNSHGYSQTGAEEEDEETDEADLRVTRHHREVEFLLQENHNLTQEREAARRECQELRARNEQLANDLQGSSSECETRLREELDGSIEQREFCFAQMVEKDRIIDELRKELSRR